MMKPTEVLREVAYPFTEMAVLLAMIVFLLLGRFALWGGLLGVFLMVILVPALFRYLLYILEARAASRMVPPLDAELFGIGENFWSLLPLLLVAAIAWAVYFVAEHLGQVAAIAVGLVFGLAFPAAMAILAITRSPVQGLNPLAWFRMVRVCGPDYALIFVVVGVFVAALIFFRAAGLPDFFVDMAGLYALFLFYTLTGVVVRRSGAVDMLSIPDAVELTPEAIAVRDDKERTVILGHAYGFFSRNDRTGGLAHLQVFIDASPDPEAEYRWFYDAMLEWESKDHALFFAQRYLTFLLDMNAQIDALKLIARCCLENSQFMPAAADRERALDVAQRLQHEDLVRHLSS